MTTEYAPGIAIKSCYTWVCFYKYVEVHRKPETCPVQYMDDLKRDQLYPIDQFGYFYNEKHNIPLPFEELYQEWKIQAKDYPYGLSCSLETKWMEWTDDRD